MPAAWHGAGADIGREGRGCGVGDSDDGIALRLRLYPLASSGGASCTPEAARGRALAAE